MRHACASTISQHHLPTKNWKSAQLKVFLKNKNKNKMRFPAELKYTKDHEWIRVEGNLAYVGITEFAQHELGDIVYVDVNTLGKEVSREDVFGTVEAVKTVSDLFMPLTGKILEINKKLDTNPELVNSDPYGEGWMVKIKVSNHIELDELLGAEDYPGLVH